MAELPTGSLFAGHRIEGLVGRGGMGVVYRATHLALDRSVALKLIAPGLAEEAGFRERFQRESRIAAALDHPHVITVHDAGEDQGLLFITMRLIEGHDLRGLLERDGRLEPSRAARITSQVADALDAAHASGLVHRDVKPANVLVSNSGGREHVYLTDFGLTKRDTSVASLTGTGEIVGTLDYIAPEQIRGEAVDARTDVYALGCMFFHLVTGEVPFPHELYAAKVFAHLSDPPPDVSSRVPGCSSALDEVVRRAMDKDPDRRQQTAGELGAAVLAATADSSKRPASGAEATVVRPAAGDPVERAATAVLPGAGRRVPRRRRWALLAAAVAVGAVVALLAGGLFQTSSQLNTGDVRTALDSYQASLTNGDLGRLEPVLAPNFTRKLLADEQINRAQALTNFRAALKFRGAASRFSLTNIKISAGEGSASASAHFSWTGEKKPHLGDYGFARFHLVERDGRVQLDRLETFPDVIAFLPPGLKRSDFPIAVTLTATTRSNGRSVEIAHGRTRLSQAVHAVDLPLSATGRAVMHSNQPFKARTLIELADGRRLPEQSYVGHFLPNVTGPSGR